MKPQHLMRVASLCARTTQTTESGRRSREIVIRAHVDSFTGCESNLQTKNNNFVNFGITIKKQSERYIKILYLDITIVGKTYPGIIFY